MGSANHKARDSESAKAPDAGGPSGESAARGRSASEQTPDALRTEAARSELEVDGPHAAVRSSETRASQPAPAVMPAAPPAGTVHDPEPADEIEPHVAISFGLDGDHPPSSSGPVSRSNIAGRYR